MRETGRHGVCRGWKVGAQAGMTGTGWWPLGEVPCQLPELRQGPASLSSVLATAGVPGHTPSISCPGCLPPAPLHLGHAYCSAPLALPPAPLSALTRDSPSSSAVRPPGAPEVPCRPPTPTMAVLSSWAARTLASLWPEKQSEFRAVLCPSVRGKFYFP